MHYALVVQVKRCGLQPIDLTAKTFMHAIRILTKIAENSKSKYKEIRRLFGGFFV